MDTFATVTICDKTSGLSFDTELYHHEYKKRTRNFETTKENEQKERKRTYCQTSRLENPEEL
jgi:hypothetical protein